MKLGIATKDDTQILPEIPRSQVRLLWINDFYDGPLQGVAEVQGHRVLFDLIDRDSLGTDEERRAYWLIALDSEQLRDEERWSDLFCRKVGTHFDFTGRPAPPKQEIDFDAFYEPYRRRTEPDYGENEILGWFQL